jgi:hypothetical protein
MLPRAIGVVVVLLLPSLAAGWLGFEEHARMVLLGTLCAFHLGMLARPIAPFALLLPLVYAGAALTAHFTDGVAALLIAVAAVTGAASSLGYHRGLLALLAAALIGSFEPGSAPDVTRNAAFMMAGCVCGWLAAATVGRVIAVRLVAVGSQTALGYAMLLAILVIIAWLTARAAGLEGAWWLPLTVAALGDPWLEGTPGQAVGRLAIALGATLLSVALVVSVGDPLLRGLLTAGLMLLLLGVGVRHVALRTFLLTPLLVLAASQDGGADPGHFLATTMLAYAVVATCTVLGKWTLWTLRPDAGHAAA